MKRIQISKWVLDHPLLSALALAVIGAIVTGFDHVFTATLSTYKNIVWNTDRSLEWPAFTDAHARSIDLSQILTYTIEAVVLTVVPLFAFASAIGARVRRDGAAGSTGASADDTMVAMTCVHLIHTELENPMAFILNDLEERQLPERRLVDPETSSPTRAYLRSDVAQFLRRLRQMITPKLERVRNFTEGFSPSHSRPGMWVGQNRPFLDVVYEMLDASGRRLGDTSISERWRWGIDPEGGRGTGPIIDLRVQPDNFRFPIGAAPNDRTRVAFADVPDSIVQIPIAEAIKNAVRAVLRHRPDRASADGESQEPDLFVTVYVTYDVLWVYVNDTGSGLGRRRHSDLAELGVTYHEGGRGMGLYVCEALSRVGACRYYLDDALEGGAVARIMFARSRRADPEAA